MCLLIFQASRWWHILNWDSELLLVVGTLPLCEQRLASIKELWRLLIPVLLLLLVYDLLKRNRGSLLISWVIHLTYGVHKRVLIQLPHGFIDREKWILSLKHIGRIGLVVVIVVAGQPLGWRVGVESLGGLAVEVKSLLDLFYVFLRAHQVFKVARLLRCTHLTLHRILGEKRLWLLRRLLLS